MSTVARLEESQRQVLARTALVYGPEFSPTSIEIFRETARDMLEKNKEKIIELMEKKRKPFIHEGLRVMPMLKGCCKVTFSIFCDEVRFDFILGLSGPLRGIYHELQNINIHI